MERVIEHHIQREIIRQLGFAGRLRFSELKPSGLENNSFMYHLRSLQRAGYLAQDEDKAYSLTNEGAAYLDRISYETDRPRIQPKLIAILALHNEKGHYLFAQRKTAPTVGTWMLPSGKQHAGESPETHVRRELRSLLGVTEIPMKRQGYMDLRLWDGEQLVTHLSGHVYRGAYEGDVLAETEKYTYARLAPDDVSNLTPGTVELLEALTDSEPFYLSLDVSAG